MIICDSIQELQKYVDDSLACYQSMSQSIRVGEVINTSGTKLDIILHAKSLLWEIKVQVDCLTKKRDINV